MKIPIETVMQIMAKNPVPVSTVVHLGTRELTKVETAIGFGRHSIQWVRKDSEVHIPIGSRTVVSTAKRSFRIDSIRPRDGHTRGTIIRRLLRRYMIEPGHDTQRVQHLGVVKYHDSDW